VEEVEYFLNALAIRVDPSFLEHLSNSLFILIADSNFSHASLRSLSYSSTSGFNNSALFFNDLKSVRGGKDKKK